MEYDDYVSVFFCWRLAEISIVSGKPHGYDSPFSCCLNYLLSASSSSMSTHLCVIWLLGAWPCSAKKCDTRPWTTSWNKLCLIWAPLRMLRSDKAPLKPWHVSFLCLAATLMSHMSLRETLISWCDYWLIWICQSTKRLGICQAHSSSPHMNQIRFVSKSLGDCPWLELCSDSGWVRCKCDSLHSAACGASVGSHEWPGSSCPLDGHTVFCSSHSTHAFGG